MLLATNNADWTHLYVCLRWYFTDEQKLKELVHCQENVVIEKSEVYIKVNVHFLKFEEKMSWEDFEIIRVKTDI